MKNNLSEEISIVNVKPQLVLGMRKTGPYQSIAVMIPQICQFAAQNGIQMIGPPLFVCHETSPEAAIQADKEGNADVEVAVPIAMCGEETEEIKCYKLPGAKMAKIIHKGPYREETATYQKLFAWLEENGKAAADGSPLRR